MQTTKPFGRRASPRPDSPPPVQKLRIEMPAADEAAPPITPQPPVPEVQFELVPAKPALTVEQEIEEWNAARKIRRRSFREPWRSVSFAAGLGFVATSWMLPENVANIAEVALGVLSIGSFCAGWRKPKPV
jgi:hypothetical protein